MTQQQLKIAGQVLIIIVMTVTVRFFGLIGLIPIFVIGWILDMVLETKEDNNA